MKGSAYAGQPAVFLDRDGVIIANRADHIKSWEEVEFLPGALEALRRLANAGIPVVIVTNQGAVGRGIISHKTAWEVQNRIVEEIESRGGKIAGSFLCPHHPDDGCECRKPRPGMIQQAVADLGVIANRSIMVGDAVTDVQSALAAGCRAVLLRSGRGRDQERLLGGEECTILEDLVAAVELILADPQYQKEMQTL